MQDQTIESVFQVRLNEELLWAVLFCNDNFLALLQNNPS